MSASFSTQLRAGDRTIRLAPEGATGALRLRVEFPETWATVRLVVLPSEPIIALKTQALDALFPQAEYPDDFVLKLRGWEVLDEQATVGDAGAVDGSIFLLTHRRKQPVR